MKLARSAFLLLVLSLPLMKHNVTVGGLAVVPADLLFLLASAGLAFATAVGRARLRWDPLYGLLLAYFGAMLTSAFAAADAQRALLKLATQLYLLTLPLLAAMTVERVEDLRSTFRAWLAAATVVGAVGTIGVIAFFCGADPLGVFGYPMHHFGTLPPGPYPRVESTFDYPAMLCNYLTASLGILLVSRHLGWIGGALFWVVLGLLGTTALFSLTPGLGGIFLALGLWVFLRERGPRSWAALAGGGVLAAAFVAIATVTPIVHPTAPFLFDFPGLAQPLAPSVRLMTCMDAVARIGGDPLLGSGIGSDAVAVRYDDPSGTKHLMTDAHNVFLNFAAQTGLVGLAAMLAIVLHVARRTFPLRLQGFGAVRVMLGLTWLNAFVYQGLTGSYEDARHLWLLLGLLIAAERLETNEAAELRPAAA
jgi:O-antigen ligase